MKKKKVARKKREYTAEDYRNAQRQILGIPMERALNYAQAFGPNWACIISGLGDQ
jgi:hypothetical protein